MYSVGSELHSKDNLFRVQQYNVNARFAVGESGIERSTAGIKGTIPSLIDAATQAVSINLQGCRENVTDFSNMVRSHMDKTVTRGGVARVEIAVHCGADPMASLASAIHDVLLLVQQHTHSYDFAPWQHLINFFAQGLQSRIESAIEEMSLAYPAGDPSVDVARREEVADVVIDAFGIIKPFYSGKGTLRSTQRTLSRTAYVYNRPILTKFRAQLSHCRNEILCKGGINWVEKFYLALQSHKGNMRAIPDFVANNKTIPKPQIVPGMACPRCFSIFSQRDEYLRHLCTAVAAGAPSTSRDPPIPLHSARFLTYHMARLNEMTKDQQILLTFLLEMYMANLYMAGLGGTGKSFTARIAAADCQRRYGMLSTVLLAPTNVAAMNINGQTVASFLGCTTEDLSTISVKEVVQNFLKHHSKQADVIRDYLQFLFVDEVGMMTAAELDLLDDFLCELRGNKKGSFGGVKVILIGDPLQVPPVGRQAGRGFFFQSKVFCRKQSKFLVLYLKEIMRTQNVPFADFQEASRLGGEYLTDLDMEYCLTWGKLVSKVGLLQSKFALEDLFQQRIQDPTSATMQNKLAFFYALPNRLDEVTNKLEQLDILTCGQQPYTICLENEEMNYLNAQYVEQFPDLQGFAANDTWSSEVSEQLRKEHAGKFRLPAQIKIAVGMTVVFLWNKVAPSVGKNTLGVITKILPNIIEVRLLGKQGENTVTVKSVKETVRIPFESRYFTASREQFPIKGCVAGNHYTVQGQTLAVVPCLYANGRIRTDLWGAGYTIISRFTDPDYIVPLFPFERVDFVAHSDAVRFDQYHSQQASPVTTVNYCYCYTSVGSIPVPNCASECECLLCLPALSFLAKTKEALCRSREQRAIAAARLASQAAQLVSLGRKRSGKRKSAPAESSEYDADAGDWITDSFSEYPDSQEAYSIAKEGGKRHRTPNTAKSPVLPVRAIKCIGILTSPQYPTPPGYRPNKQLHQLV